MKNKILSKKFLSGALLLTLISAFGFWTMQSVSAHENGKNELRIKERLNGFKKELRLRVKGNGILNNQIIDRFIASPAIIGIEDKNFKAEVISVSGDVIKVNVKGVEMTVNTDANDIIVNRVWDRINVSSIQPGDKLRVIGQNFSGTTIEARVARDLSIPRVLEKTLTGKVTSITGNSFKLQVGTKEFTVNVDANDIIVTRLWNKITLADIKVGDRVNVFGAVNNLSVDAKLVRDLSIPEFQVQTFNDLELEIEDD